MSIPPSDLPAPWESSGDGYAHAFLDYRLTVGADPYRVVVHAPDGPRTLETPAPIESMAEAEDWALAVMANVERAYAPDCPGVVGAALERTCDKNEARTDASAGRRCLLCGAPLRLFGDDSFAGAGYEAHLRYVDDDVHARAEALLDDPYAV